MPAAISGADKTKDLILTMLKESRRQPGDRVPSEEELSRRFRASRPTIREALRQLEHERVLYCVHGRGRFVAGSPQVYLDSIARLRSVTELAASLGFTLSTTVHAVRKRPPTRQEGQALRLGPEDMVIELERTRSAESEPVIYAVDIFPERLVVGVPDEHAWSGSLLELMETSWGVTITHAEATIRAVRLSAKLASRIRVPSSLPWIMLEQTNFDAHRRPVLYSQDYHRGDKFTFRLLRSRSRTPEARREGQRTAHPE